MLKIFKYQHWKLQKTTHLLCSVINVGGLIYPRSQCVLFKNYDDDDDGGDDDDDDEKEEEEDNPIAYLKTWPHVKDWCRKKSVGWDTLAEWEREQAHVSARVCLTRLSDADPVPQTRYKF